MTATGRSATVANRPKAEVRDRRKAVMATARNNPVTHERQTRPIRARPSQPPSQQLKVAKIASNRIVSRTTVDSLSCNLRGQKLLLLDSRRSRLFLFAESLA
jgi:hypothetical protein